MAPILLWHRRDLRLSDNPALDWAVAQGRPVIPVFVLDEVVHDWGAAPRWRLGLSLASHAARLGAAGSRLILRRGDALPTLRALIAETGADTVVWNRLHVAGERARDGHVAEALAADGIAVETVLGHILFDPERVETGSGGYYKVFTPFFRAVRDRDPGAPLPAPEAIPAPADWPASDDLDGWDLGVTMRRGADVVAHHVTVGEEAARARLDAFVADRMAGYDRGRDMLSEDGTSGLSENLTYGEIGVRTCWDAARSALADGRPGAETFLKEIVWRDFAHHLAWHTPRLTTDNWKPDWDRFPWAGDNDRAEAWRRGRTGIDVVDAAMRELYVTGRMHNRARMLVASFLTKHLMTHWKVGADWFADTLIDWDPASNAMGWQWAAGSGPDASPFFRIFNPATQAEKFDPDAGYRSRWLEDPSFYDAIPVAWGMDPADGPPMAPIVGLKEGREAALAAYRDRDAG